MTISEIGLIAEKFWYEIPKLLKNIQLGEFVIMPNHIHGILIIPPVGAFHGMPNATMPNATMPNATMPNATMPNATMPNATMPNATMPNATMPNAKASIPNTIMRKQEIYTGLIRREKMKHLNAFSKPIKGSVSVVLNQYKSSVTRWCNENEHSYFKWQSRFYDNVIRDKKSYFLIRNYIINNRKNWSKDMFNTQ
jgi:putative transposase